MISEIILPGYFKKFRDIISKVYSSALIDKNTWCFLNVGHPVIPKFYVMPKVHKSLVDPPDRPIVSGIGCLTEHASELMDDYLRPFVFSLLSYIQDTRDLLPILENLIIPRDAWMVTTDVEALYSSIPHRRGLQVIGDFLREKQRPLWPYNYFVLRLLEHPLSKHFCILGLPLPPGARQPVPGGGGSAMYFLVRTHRWNCATLSCGTGTLTIYS